MKILINCAFLLLAASSTCTAQTTTGNTNTSISAERFINQAALGGLKEVATSKIAKNKAQNAEIKSFAMMMVNDHSKVNEELKALAKSKNIKLPKPDIKNMPNATVSHSTDARNTNNSGTTASSDKTRKSKGNSSKNNNNNNQQTGDNNNSNNTGNSGATSGNTNADVRSTTGIPVITGTERTMQIGTDSLKLLTELEISLALQQLSNLEGAAFDETYAQMMIDDHKNAIILFERGSQSTDTDIRTFARKHLPTLRSHLIQITNIRKGIGRS